MRVFLALGTHPQQFNRLLEAVDQLIESGKLKGHVFAQTGNSAYIPRHFSWKQFISPHEFEKEMKKADIIVSHGGAGTIISALTQKKPLIIVPRRVAFGEHTDNHQFDLAKAMHKRKKAIAVFELKNLSAALTKAKHFSASNKSEKETLISRISKFVEAGK